MRPRNSLIASSVANAHVVSLATSIKTQTNSTRHGGWMFTRSKFLIFICAQISLFWSYDGQAEKKNAIIKINLSTSLLKEGLQRIEWPLAVHHSDRLISALCISNPIIKTHCCTKIAASQILQLQFSGLLLHIDHLLDIHLIFFQLIIQSFPVYCCLKYHILSQVY